MSSFTFTCTQCVRRLTRLAQISQASRHLGLRQTPTTHEYAPLLAGRHQYSTAAPRKRKVRMTGDMLYVAFFKREDVPPLEFFKTAMPIQNMSAEECLATTTKYVDAAVKNVTGWRARLINLTSTNLSAEKSTQVSAYTLYHVAMALVTAPNKEAWRIARHIFHTLTKLDYAPVVLTLVSNGFRRDTLHDVLSEAPLEHFMRFTKRIEDAEAVGKASEIEHAADACTLRALIEAEKGTREAENDALRWFRRAYEIDAALAKTQPEKSETEGDKSEETPRWQWKTSFALAVGDIHLKRGKLQQARDMYKMIAHDLDHPLGYLKLAELLEKEGKTDSEEYVDWLEKAAISGSGEAAQKMGIRERERAGKGDLSAWEKLKSQVLAEEWLAVADGRDGKASS